MDKRRKAATQRGLKKEKEYCIPIYGDVDHSAVFRVVVTWVLTVHRIESAGKNVTTVCRPIIRLSLLAVEELISILFTREHSFDLYQGSLINTLTGNWATFVV